MPKSRSTKKSIRVLLVDDHALFRQGFRLLLSEIRSMEVVAEASNGFEALELMASSRPDIVFLDITMQGMNGMEALHEIIVRFPGVRVVVVSMHSDGEYVAECFKLGAMGYMLKDANKKELRVAIKAILKDKKYLSPGLVTRGMRADAPFRQLTSRQRVVLQLIGEGLSTKEIAQRLGISFKTAETHRTQLMARLDIHDVAGLVRYAISRGLVDAEP